jgi:very-short-patch-repair endonuclease
MDWKTPEEQQKTDIYKEKCANDNGYSIIRLLQDDVLNDKYDWKTELVNNIEKIKIDNIIQNIYMCKNNEYDDFMN